MSRVRVPEGVPSLEDVKNILEALDRDNQIVYIWHVPNVVGVFNGEGPPVPIPNTEVKLTSAENTCLATDWEDRSMPTQKVWRESNLLICLLSSIGRACGC